MTTRLIDLEADLNCEDDEGRWWSVLDWGTDPSKIVPSVIAGDGRTRALVRIDQTDDDGQVHFVGATPAEQDHSGWDSSGGAHVPTMYQHPGR